MELSIFQSVYANSHWQHNMVVTMLILISSASQPYASLSQVRNMDAALGGKNGAKCILLAGE